MTRKCVLCKETNYRNTYSFFSAPKDPETRKKWQNAIAIENYIVTDDTYVCSKHFHKDDIITHWVSGVPPHVITIKYKKCRLRPGAVPGRNYHLEENKNDQSDDSDVNIGSYSPFMSQKTEKSERVKEDFTIPRTEEKLEINIDQNSRVLDQEYSNDFDDYTYMSNGNLHKLDISENGSNMSNASLEEAKEKESPINNSKIVKQNQTVYLEEGSIISNIDSVDDKRDEQNETREGDSYSKKTVDSTKIFNISEGDDTSTELWEHKSEQKDLNSKEKSVDSNYTLKEDNWNYDMLDCYYSMYNIEENEMLFEDLLEVCTEVLLPRGWSCLVTSKGLSTTIVYLYMGMTKSGMPFTEKQVFIKSDMILRCSAVNREINPLIHNLVREGKHLKVQNLLDIEELIDEFDQRTVCQGMYNTEGLKKMNNMKIAYKDGVKWRHVLCPLIVNNGSLRCTRCIALSHALQRRSNNFHSSCSPPILSKKRQRIHLTQEGLKRTRKHDRRREFLRPFKE